ncbi:S8 family serine peptidase [Saccharothrix deserti]|uniref:S8 family serine peptidase n=1 Tax=Saccharothrix deserti TaxID=2593674 RepID=UPI001EE4EAE1|nr:S8 family serine peptidase [Saccharothrix deserti]
MPRNRQQHGAHLQAELQQVVTAPRRLDAGVDPSLVFKIRAAGRPQENSLEARKLQVLGETVSYTYFVLSNDGTNELAVALAEYARTGALYSLVDLINDIEPYGPEDRRGPGLAPPPDGQFLVDVIIWPSPDGTEARRRASIVDAVLAQTEVQAQLRSVSPRRNLIRARVNAEGLEDLLNTSVVELVRTPPVPFLDFRDWRTLQSEDLPHRITVASAAVGVLDDAPASAHPLLYGLVESVDPVGPPNYPWQQPGDHGSEVVGRVLLPFLHEELREGSPFKAYGTVRVARILEPDPNNPSGAPRFAVSDFPHTLVEKGIRHLHKTYGVRIFNLSVGYSEPYSDIHLDALTETIDELVRELNIVVVVPTGNVVFHSLSAMTPSGHHAADDYPKYLDTPEHRLSEPAPAALALTVGSLALSEGVAEIGSNRLGWQAIASADQVSPFSRTGPGTGSNERRRNKPEVVHYGGNLVLSDLGHVVTNDMGASLVSTAINSTNGQLFKACNGTSYAAPAVARIAADITHAYPDASANLIRALLAGSARLPDTSADNVEEHRKAARFGLGRPDTERAINSGNRRATMTYDGAMPVDTVHLHPVPVPEVFRRGSGSQRTLIIALAFDPPVRRQRREYLHANMQVDLYRNIDLDELREVLRRQESTNALDPIRDRRRPPLIPGSDFVASSTLQVRSWTMTNSFVNDDDIFYVAVTHRAATWARNDPRYLEQSYALTVTLEDQHLVHANLHQLLTQQVRLPARLRIRP